MSSYEPTAKSPVQCSVFWFRRDLRIEDNHGLYQALKSGRPIRFVFIFDPDILDKLPRSDARVEFIHERLGLLKNSLLECANADHPHRLEVFVGKPLDIWKSLFQSWNIAAIYCNEDYEPSAVWRDEAVAALAKKNSATFQAYKDQVVFAKDEVVKDDGEAYRVFTPFARKWKSLLQPAHLRGYPSRELLRKAMTFDAPSREWPTLEKIGFKPSGLEFPAPKISTRTIKNYAQTRDQLGETGTTHLGLHLRFGTLSIRQLMALARVHSEVFMGELIWREFFMQILHHYPHTVNEPFDSRYKNIKWRDSDKDFLRWCEGQTGYPIVDAGMRELNATGFMHNRARMITASFLSKHLLIDWRRGERYFAEKLLDYEQSANVGNWQWVAGCGCDAAPYFRIFNPTLQAKKFDAQGAYVNQWVPELKSKDYPEPMVDHEMARRRALTVFKQALQAGAEK